MQPAVAHPVARSLVVPPLCPLDRALFRSDYQAMDLQRYTIEGRIANLQFASYLLSTIALATSVWSDERELPKTSIEASLFIRCLFRSGMQMIKPNS